RRQYVDIEWPARRQHGFFVLSDVTPHAEAKCRDAYSELTLHEEGDALIVQRLHLPSAENHPNFGLRPAGALRAYAPDPGNTRREGSPVVGSSALDMNPRKSTV